MISFDYDETLCEKFTSIMLPNVQEKLLDLLKDYNICVFTKSIEYFKKRQLFYEEVQGRLNEFKLKLKNHVSLLTLF